MKSKVVRFHKAKRVLEYVAFFYVELPTREGPAFTYFAVDAFSEFAILTGTEPKNSDEIYLKHIRRLLIDPDFAKHIHNGFTLVLADHQELSDEIKLIISNKNGRLMYDSDFHGEIILPVIESFSAFLKKSKAKWSIIAYNIEIKRNIFLTGRARYNTAGGRGFANIGPPYSLFENYLVLSSV